MAHWTENSQLPAAKPRGGEVTGQSKVSIKLNLESFISVEPHIGDIFVKILRQKLGFWNRRKLLLHFLAKHRSHMFLLRRTCSRMSRLLGGEERRISQSTAAGRYELIMCAFKWWMSIFILNTNRSCMPPTTLPGSWGLRRDVADLHVQRRSPRSPAFERPWEYLRVVRKLCSVASHREGTGRVATNLDEMEIKTSQNWWLK